MNGHLEQWLDAYLDGELDDVQIRQAEAHLESCPACRADLGQRRALSPLLRAEPPAEGSKSEQRFVAEIGLRLQRKPAVRRTGARPSALVWGMIPVALVLAWAFVQAAAIVVGALEAIPGAEEMLMNGFAASIPQLSMPDIVRDGPQWIAVAGFGSWDDIVLMMAFVGIGVLFTGWFAGWWISQRAAGSQR